MQGADGPTASLWPNQPQYSSLVAVRNLQEKLAADAAMRYPRSAGDVASSHPNAAVGEYGAHGNGAVHGFGEEGPPLTYLHAEQLQTFDSAGLAKRVKGGAFSQTTREDVLRGLRLMAEGKTIPPNGISSSATDLDYDGNWLAQSHRRREPAVKLPPNRHELSKRWLQAAATAYL